jgi:hypothetical protein
MKWVSKIPKEGVGMPMGGVQDTGGGAGVWLLDSRAKEAVTVTFAVTLTVHVPVPEHPPPLHPEKVEPVEGVAVRVMEVPEDMEDWEQVEPQEMEPPETVPEPVPDLDTVRV